MNGSRVEPSSGCQELESRERGEVEGGGLEYVKTLVFFLSCKSNDKYGRVLDGRCDDVQGSKEEGKGVTGLFLKCGRMRS